MSHKKSMVMKRILLSIFVALAAAPGNAQTIYTSVQSGEATNNATWDISKNLNCNELGGVNVVILHEVSYGCKKFGTGWNISTEVRAGGIAIYEDDLTVSSGDGLPVNLRIYESGKVIVGGNYTPKWGVLSRIFSNGEMIVKKNATINEGPEGQITFIIGQGGKLVVDGDLQLDGMLHIESGGILEVKGNYKSNNGIISTDPGAIIHIDGNVVLDGWNPITGILLDGNSSLYVGGSYSSQNGWLRATEGSSIYIAGDLNLTGSERVALSLTGVDDFQVLGNTLIDNSAKIEITNSQATFYGDLTTSGGSRRAVLIEEESEVVVKKDYISSGGITQVQESVLTIEGQLLVNNGGADVTVVSSSQLIVNNGVKLSNSGKLNLNDSDLIVQGDLQASGGGTGFLAGNGSNVEVNGSFYLLGSAVSFLINSEMVVQSVLGTDTNGNPTYIGGNVLIQGGGSVMTISDNSVLAILGNKNLGVEVDDPFVQGDLILMDNGVLYIEPFGKILIYHNVYRLDINGNPVTSKLFYTNWNPPQLPEPVPLFVILGGVSCDEWWGPPGTCRDGDATLPVELLSFEAVADGREVTLNWQTATELNNDYFTVERSSDGINFERIGKVMGNGTTKESKSYTFKDRAPLPGMGYYRLSQTDYDGGHEVLGTRAVNFLPGESGLSAYPNPLYDDVLTLRISGLEANREALIRIIDPAGRTVYQENLDTGNGHLIRELNLEGRLERGMYMINVIQGNRRFTGKLSKM